MNYLAKMYGRSKPTPESSSSDKNPNRVSGGLKAQGGDHFTMIAENGLEQQIPTQRYVQSLEEQSRKQRAAITVLERKLTRVEAALEQMKSVISRP
mgnify:FL=1|tara:strand:- start:505 stop:792 length:288 start_codon:yes stop_codon:yes gene_type:complete